MKTFFATLVSVLLFSCKAVLIETASPDTPIVNNHFTYENDTISITYSFWADGGLMSYTVKNKMKSAPLYIDWKQGAFIFADKKFNYWSGMELTNTSGVGVSGRGISSYNSRSITTKQEEVAFLPPGTSSTYTFTEILNSKRTWRIYDNLKSGEIEFNENNSTVTFSNFITYSTNAQFNSPSFVFNKFYVNKAKKYRQTKILNVDKDDNTIYSPTRFFIYR
jgi:hypothetical protein